MRTLKSQGKRLPVLKTNPHELTVRIGTKLYGCSNRVFAAGYHVPQRCYSPDGSFEMVTTFIRHTMSTECRQENTLTDIRCNECRERGLGDAYVNSVKNNGA